MSGPDARTAGPDSRMPGTNASFAGNSYRQWTFLGCCVLAGIVIGFAIAVLVESFTRPIQFAIYGDKGIKLYLPGKQMHHADMVNLLMKNDSEENKQIRKDTLALLAANHDVYKFGQYQLIARIGRENKETDYAAQFVNLVKQRRGPFRSLKLYDLDSPQTANRIQNLDYSHPLIKRLRQEVIIGRTNLIPQDLTVRLSFSDEVPMDRAAVCKESEFYRNRIRVFQPDRNEYIVVFASLDLNDKQCPKKPDSMVQISSKHTKLQFKSGTLARTEQGQFTERPVLPMQ